MSLVKCWSCGGKGKYYDGFRIEICRECKGTGKAEPFTINKLEDKEKGKQTQ